MTSPRFMSIRNQIIALIVLMTLLSLGIIVYTAYKQQQHDIDEAVDMVTSVSSQISNDQKILIAGAEQLAATVSALPIVKQRSTAEVNSLLAELVKKNPQLTNIIIIGSSGSLWASAIPTDKSLSYKDRKYFKNAVTSGKISSGEYTIGKISPFPIFSFAYPIKDHSGSVSDVIAVVYSLDRYNQLYNGEKIAPVSSILLVDHNGTILYSSADSRLVGKSDRPDLFSLMSSGPNEGTLEAEGNLGIRRIFSYRKLWLEGEKEPYMYIRTGLNKDYVLAKARKDLKLGVGVMLSAMLIMLGMTVWFCKRNVLDKIAAIQKITQRIAQGDLTARFPDLFSGGELGDLGLSFNEMAKRLQQSDEAKRESEEQYRELVDNAVSIILKVDNEGRITFFNEYAQHFFGFTETEILGRNVIGSIVPETESTGRDMAEVVNNILTLPDANAHIINENIRKNGERVWISWNNHNLIDSDGSKAGILSVGQDITERKRIENELQRSEERFRSYVESANDVVFALTPDGRFSYVSPNWSEAFGYDLDETIGKPFIPFVHADDVPGCLEFMHRIFSTGHNQSGIEYRVLCKDGRYLWYKANASLIKDSYTESVTLIGIGRDITERKLYEEILRQSEEKFSTVFKASPDAIILSHFHDGLILDVNESFTRITGFTAEEVIGKTSLELGIWKDYNDRSHLESVIKRSGEIKCFEAYFNTRDGSNVLGQISARTIDIDDMPCLLTIMRDITQRELILSERIKAQKLESISVLAGGIAHNFNNVLTGIIGYISYARKHLDDPGKVSQLLESAEKSSYRAAGLARQLLTFSQGNSTSQETVPVDTLVEESVSLFLSGSNVRGTITCDSQQVIKVDSQQVNQAFNNIVLNALHAMPDGGTLEVRVDSINLDENNRYALSAGDYVRIIFEDSGCGIVKDDLNKVFDPYFSTKDTGTGLGLSTTHSIISKHGGQIDIASEVGAGTIVTVILPSYSGEDPACDKTGEWENAEQDDISVLVMDDEEVIREFIEDVLKDKGVTVETCANGEEACALYKKFMDTGKSFTVVVLDLSIPDGMGAVETAQQILGIDPHACLIASSGYANDPALAEFQKFGFSGSIAKPFSGTDLFRTITRAFQNRPS